MTGGWTFRGVGEDSTLGFRMEPPAMQSGFPSEAVVGVRGRQQQDMSAGVGKVGAIDVKVGTGTAITVLLVLGGLVILMTRLPKRG